MTLEFRDRKGNYIKQWPNWSGEIPQKGDTVILHFGDNNEEASESDVLYRKISGTEPDKIIVMLDYYE